MGKLCVTPLVGSLSQPRGASFRKGRRNGSVAVFGIFLVFTGAKFFMFKETESSFTEGFVWKYCKKIIPSTAKFDGNKFFIKTKDKWSATPLLYALI